MIEIKTMETRYDNKKFFNFDEYYKTNINKIDFNNKNIMWIYKITDLINNKIYIGKTKDIHRRSLEYVNEYTNNVGKRRLLWKKIKEHGIDNFKMEPIYVTYDENDALNKELYFIKKFNSMNPEIGYNVSYQSVRAVHNINAKVRFQKADEKMRRSKLFCAINPETSTLYFSTGLKLFGSLINRSKDEIKSAAKRSMPLNGFYLYYLTNDIFEKQIENTMCLLEKWKLKTNSKSNNEFIMKYSTFIELSNHVVNILCEDEYDDFFSNYDIFFVHQEDNSCGYTFTDPLFFINNYKRLKSNNLILYIKKYNKSNTVL